MLLLEIVGVTLTNKIFVTTFAYLRGKKKDNYTWTLQNLRSLMHKDFLPSTCTNRELTLMNVVHNVFATFSHFLCR